MRTSLALLVALALVACKKPEPPPPPLAFPGVPAGAVPQMPPQANVLAGKVLEKVDAPPYSYLKLATAQGEIWAAVPQANVASGSEVGVVNAFPMKDFESKTLNKKFQVVYFGTLAGDAPAPAPGPALGTAPPGTNTAAVAAQHQAAAQGPTEVKVVKVARAGGPDGRTVEEIWTQRARLKGKSVTVKGQVVKFSPGIMERNWIHLRDGTGSGDKQDNDVTVTTNDGAKVGDVVTVKGTVALDKDFGAGYAYPVIIEGAKVTAGK